jgi:hypothetical protein
MRRTVYLVALFVFTVAQAAVAQSTPPPTPQPVTPALPFSTAAPPATVVPSAQDARLAACAAPNAPNFVPYVVRPGDRLPDLLTGSTTITPAQLAALNCLDTADVVPVGAVIWLPADAFVVVQSNPAAEATAEATIPNAQIATFSADTESILNDQVVTLTWQAQGAAAYVYPCPSARDAGCLRPRSAQPQPVSGSLTISDFPHAGSYTFRLEVTDAETPATEDLTIEVTCAQQWLGGLGASPRCPEDPARTVTAVWQPFEGGVMIWFSDTQQIYAMTNADGRVRVFQDTYVEGSPDPEAAAPEGLLTPIRGFGLVWQALGGAEGSGLGWALAPEIGFDSARQPAGRTSYTTYVQGPGETVYAITEIPAMEMGYWAQVAG